MAKCLHCIHSVTNIATGEMKCGCEEAHEALEPEALRSHLRGGEHECPFFEDDELPW